MVGLWLVLEEILCFRVLAERYLTHQVAQEPLTEAEVKGLALYLGKQPVLARVVW